MNDWPEPGPGRVDPFNPPKFSILEQPVDDTIGNSDMMSLWGIAARTGDAFHWDGLNRSLREVMVSSAIGDGASRKSVDTASLARVEEWIRSVRPPAYPFPIDATLAEAGQRVYEASCATCHRAGGARAGTVIPIDEVGTDRHRLDMWTADAAEAYNNYGEDYPWGLSQFRKTNGYIALLHDGLWAQSAVPAQRIGADPRRFPGDAGQAADNVLPRRRSVRPRQSRIRFDAALMPSAPASSTTRVCRPTATRAISGVPTSRPRARPRSWST